MTEATTTLTRAAGEQLKRTVLMRLATMPAIKTFDQFDWAQAVRQGWAPRGRNICLVLRRRLAPYPRSP